MGERYSLIVNLLYKVLGEPEFLLWLYSFGAIMSRVGGRIRKGAFDPLPNLVLDFAVSLP